LSKLLKAGNLQRMTSSLSKKIVEFGRDSLKFKSRILYIYSIYSINSIYIKCDIPINDIEVDAS